MMNEDLLKSAEYKEAYGRYIRGTYTQDDLNVLEPARIEPQLMTIGSLDALKERLEEFNHSLRSGSGIVITEFKN